MVGDEAGLSTSSCFWNAGPVPLCLFATVYHCVLRVACVRGQRFLGAVTSGVG